MSNTAFALVDNSFQDSSRADGNLSPPVPNDNLLRETHAQRVRVSLKQARNTALRTTEIAETLAEDRKATDEYSNFVAVGEQPDIGRIVALPKLNAVAWASPSVSFHALQEWEGYVLEEGEEAFTARLWDLTDGSVQESEEAVIPLAEISDDDHRRLQPGSIFRWVIGYERSRGGTKRRISEIVFRDLPATTGQDMLEGQEWAQRVSRTLWG